MKKWLSIGIFFGIYSLYSGDVQQPWTWLVKKIFTPLEKKNNGVHKELVLTKISLPLFSQMIFSWNAFRPTRGYFTFWVQARDAATKEWYDWHKMMVWGANVQHTFFSCYEGKTTFHHVRLEIPPEKKADGIRIRIDAHDGADLSLFHALFMCLSNFEQFDAEDATAYAALPSVRIRGVPIQSQMILKHPKCEVLCSPTSCSMVMGYYTRHFNALQYAGKVYDSGLEAYGSWPFNVAHGFELSRGKVLFYVRRLNSFQELYSYLQKKIPVVVSVRGPLKGAPLPYQQGHLLTVIGWDNKKRAVLCHDPAFDANEKVFVSYPIRSFLAAWERSRRLAYIPEP